MKRLIVAMVVAVTFFGTAIVTAGPGEGGSYVPKVVYDGPELSGPQNDGGYGLDTRVATPQGGGYDSETDVAMTSWGGSGSDSV